MTDNDRPPEYSGPIMSIEKAAEEVTTWYIFNTGCADASEIMSGCCAEWAEAVIERIEDARFRSGDGHCWVEYDGMYYDAETPNGVDDPDDLPFFAERGGRSAWL